MFKLFRSLFSSMTDNCIKSVNTSINSSELSKKIEKSINTSNTNSKRNHPDMSVPWNQRVYPGRKPSTCYRCHTGDIVAEHDCR